MANPPKCFPMEISRTACSNRVPLDEPVNIHLWSMDTLVVERPSDDLLVSNTTFVMFKLCVLFCGWSFWQFSCMYDPSIVHTWIIVWANLVPFVATSITIEQKTTRKSFLTKKVFLTIIAVITVNVYGTGSHSSSTQMHSRLVENRFDRLWIIQLCVLSNREISRTGWVIYRICHLRTWWMENGTNS